MPIFRLALLVLLASGGTMAAQQGQVSKQPGTQGRNEVAVGAGTTSGVTTGSSGDTGGGEDETIEPIDVDMPYPEQPEGLLGAPGSLAITAPKQLRCDIIEHEAARARCERSGTGAAD